MSEYNKELKLAHDFIKTRYETYLKSNQIKSDDDRRAYAHAVHVVGYIAYNCDIVKRVDC